MKKSKKKNPSIVLTSQERSDIDVLPRMSIAEIAALIKKHWKKVSPGARPFLNAMGKMNSIKDNFGGVSGKSIVIHFLSNTLAWQGVIAREVERELLKRWKQR